MNGIIRIRGDLPPCSHHECKRPGDDGYCTASCCGPDSYDGQRKAYCVEHSHRPTKVLEVLGYQPTQETFTRDEMLHVLRAMWVGASMVFEAEGHFEMLRDVERRSVRLQAPDLTDAEVYELGEQLARGASVGAVMARAREMSAARRDARDPGDDVGGT